MFLKFCWSVECSNLDVNQFLLIAIVENLPDSHNILTSYCLRRMVNDEGTINDVIWIRRDFNLADAMTKYKIQPQLVEFLQTGKVKYEVEQSVLRTDETTTENELPKDNQATRKEEKDECENWRFGKFESQVWVARIELTTKNYSLIMIMIWFTIWFMIWFTRVAN